MNNPSVIRKYPCTIICTYIYAVIFHDTIDSLHFLCNCLELVLRFRWPIQALYQTKIRACSRKRYILYPKLCCDQVSAFFWAKSADPLWVDSVHRSPMGSLVPPQFGASPRAHPPCLLRSITIAPHSIPVPLT